MIDGKPDLDAQLRRLAANAGMTGNAKRRMCSELAHALEGIGVTDASQIPYVSDDELLACPGIGAASIGMLRIIAGDGKE